jgi:ABC-type transporter Mla subunit MlaD
MPVVDDTRELLTRLSRLTPILESAVTDAAELTRSLRMQAADVEASVEDILERVRKQTSRVDNMFSGTLDTVERASVFVTETIAKPVRQISGLLAGLKAIVESLRSVQPSTNSVYRERGIHDDTDMFV